MPKIQYMEMLPQYGMFHSHKVLEHNKGQHDPRGLNIHNTYLVQLPQNMNKPLKLQLDEKLLCPKKPKGLLELLLLR